MDAPRPPLPPMPPVKPRSARQGKMPRSLQRKAVPSSTFNLISAIHASLLARFVFGTNLMWYRPEIGQSATVDSENEGFGLLTTFFLYSRQ